jgi:hypothetical protein
MGSLSILVDLNAFFERNVKDGLNEMNLCQVHGTFTGSLSQEGNNKGTEEIGCKHPQDETGKNGNNDMVHDKNSFKVFE